jgi:hypothetical protein
MARLTEFHRQHLPHAFDGYHRCPSLFKPCTWSYTRKHNSLKKFSSLKFHNVLAFIPTEGRLLIKLIPQVLTCSQNSNGSQKFCNKERDEKELNQVQEFKPPCILLMDSHLILSLKPIYSTPFPLITFIYVVGFIWSFLGKFSPTKILWMRCC